MNKKLTVGIIIVGGTVLAVLAGPNGPLGGFWRPQTLDPAPSGAVLAGLMGSGLVEAIGFGVALAILALGRPLFARLAGSPGKATTAWLAAAWLFGSWWPHSALHMHVGLDASALLVLEVVFHAGSIVALGLLLSALLLPTAKVVQS